MKQDDQQPVTKKYLDEFLEVVQKNLDKSLKKVQKNILDGVGDMVTTVVNHMDERFDEVDDRFNGLERKVDQTLDDHSVRIAKLEEKAA